ncbi:hypothetical protein POM88_014863 [Heracleum sosnowskyi]|uniref:Retrovirus-related Pol polyprotein from transposon TNT 1-94-like beta-barrel domain-containing protein n=1 Tax=Heracleum sosnowskyi TaxID=360622 RepID=A0AAD8MRD4_9APIA|nr:hypothetical protein POM88_014863 [Heracleum sosnowskyi]
MTYAHDIWLNLNKRFPLTNGSRKYKLSKDLYEIKQSTLSITEYYTSMKFPWEELDSMNMLPIVSNSQPEFTKLLESIQSQKEEARLFQFLNGLDKQYNAQRSQMLMLTPLPTVETTCEALEQEEAQRLLLGVSKSNQEVMAICHPRNNKGTPYKPRPQTSPGQGNGWVGTSNAKPSRMAANAQVQDITGLLFTPQQLEQLAKLMPQINSPQVKGSETDEELDYHFLGMVSPHDTDFTTTWIIDLGASDHMTPHLTYIVDPKPFSYTHKIKLPTSDNVVISHCGSAHVLPDLTLNNVLCVPQFKHNLLSVQRLIKDNNYEL